MESQLQRADEIFEKLNNNEIDEHQFTEEIRKDCPDVDPHLFVSGYYGYT
tara:strand:+ start:467 stop:616 length:150 start_codon:yes stop_codon:yes gene_type:complete